MLKYIPMFLTILSAICAPAFAQEDTERETTTTQEVVAVETESTTEAETSAE